MGWELKVRPAWKHYYNRWTSLRHIFYICWQHQQGFFTLKGRDRIVMCWKSAFWYMCLFNSWLNIWLLSPSFRGYLLCLCGPVSIPELSDTDGFRWRGICFPIHPETGEGHVDAQPASGLIVFVLLIVVLGILHSWQWHQFLLVHFCMCQGLRTHTYAAWA